MQTTTLLALVPGRLARPLAALICLAALAFPAWAQKVKLATTMGDIVLELDAAQRARLAQLLRSQPAGVSGFEQLHRN